MVVVVLQVWVTSQEKTQMRAMVRILVTPRGVGLGGGRGCSVNVVAIQSARMSFLCDDVICSDDCIQINWLLHQAQASLCT